MFFLQNTVQWEKKNSRYLHGLNGVPLLRLPAAPEVPQGQSCANVAAVLTARAPARVHDKTEHTYKALNAARPVHGNEPG